MSCANTMSLVEAEGRDDSRRVLSSVGIFDLASAAPVPNGWMRSIPLVLLAMVGTMAFVGQYRPNEASALLEAVAPLSTVFTSCLVLAAAGMVFAGFVGERSLAVLSAGVTGYLAGHWLFGILPIHQNGGFDIPFHGFQDAVSFSKFRLWYGLCVGGTALFALLVAGRLFSRMPEFRLGVGNWNATTRDFTHKSKPESYLRSLFGFAVFALVMAVITQMSVELKPLREGTLFPLIPAVLLAALVNATIEEFIFRGVMQPAIVGSAGIARGLWIQGMFFGLIHWGMSVGALAALPTSMLIGVGAVIWGKAAIATRGLSWVIVAHTMVDIAIMAAFFVPHAGKS